jgi:uncharacterized protein YyaL (SSP411 family)
MKSNYKFVSWEQKMMEKHGDDITSYVTECQSPDVSEFIFHHMEQCNFAHRYDIDNGFFEEDMRRNHIWHYSVTAIDAVTAGDTSALCIALFNLGRSVESLEHFTIEEHIKASEAIAQKMEQEMPLKIRNAKSKFLQSRVRDMAKQMWDDDLEKIQKLTRVCKILLPEAKKIANKIDCEAPTRAETLRGWLRPIAPAYATAPGRPKR